MRRYSCTIKLKTQTITREKLRKALLYKKGAHKMLMKLTPVSFVGGVGREPGHVLESGFDGVIQDGRQVLDSGASLFGVPVEQPFQNMYFHWSFWTIRQFPLHTRNIYTWSALSVPDIRRLSTSREMCLTRYRNQQVLKSDKNEFYFEAFLLNVNFNFLQAGTFAYCFCIKDILSNEVDKKCY